MRLFTRIYLLVAIGVLIAPHPANADLSHWFFRAKVNLAKARLYDLTPQGEPLAGKKQGRSPTQKKMFGLFDVRPVNVCLPQGLWSKQVTVLTKKKEQRIEFLVVECNQTRIRVHFERPIASADYAPEAIIRYLSGIFDIEGFGTDALSGALGAALADVETDGRRVAVRGMELQLPDEFRPAARRYGGGVLYMSDERVKGNRYLWSTLILSRPMTPEESALGAAALPNLFRREQERLLNVTFGKKLKKAKLQMDIGEVQGAPLLSVIYQPHRAYRRRDYVFDDTSSSIYYFESSGAKKYFQKSNPAVDSLLQTVRFREASAGSSLSTLTAPPPPSPNPSPPPAASTETYKPGVELVGASVQPAEASPGGEIKLLIQYRVSGVPPGFSFEVKESRELRLNDVAIGQTEESVSRGAGSFTSAKTIQVPPNSQPGFYQFRAKVTLAGVEAEASAFFRVQ